MPKFTPSALNGKYSKNILPQHKFHLQVSTIQHQFCSESMPEFSLPSLHQTFNHQHFKKFQDSQNFNTGLYDHTGLRTPIILHASPAAMFSTPTLYPLYHVKMDENQGKTLCTIRHKHSSYNSHTLGCVASAQSISINIQIATNHFTLQF